MRSVHHAELLQPTSYPLVLKEVWLLVKLTCKLQRYTPFQILLILLRFIARALKAPVLC